MLRTACLLVLLGAGVVAAAPGVNPKEIEEGLTCQCGCGLTVHSCNHLSCGSAIPLKREALGLIQEGLGRDEIMLRFRDKYGEKILSAPVAEGFNLAAWILPFLAVGVGTIAVVVVARRWSVASPAEADRSVTSASAADRRRLEELLRRGDD